MNKVVTLRIFIFGCLAVSWFLLEKTPQVRPCRLLFFIPEKQAFPIRTSLRHEPKIKMRQVSEAYFWGMIEDV